MYFVPQEERKKRSARQATNEACPKKSLEWRGATLNITCTLLIESQNAPNIRGEHAACEIAYQKQTMASEALHDEAGMSSTSSATAEMPGIEAATSSADEKNPVSSSSGQQAHVSGANAEANQQNGNGDGDGDGDVDVVAATQTSSARKANANLCGVCEINPGKYKCSRCRLP
jgi:hypothetical protein